MAKVLVIEDDTGMRRAIRYLLEADGHKAVEAVDGRDGIDALIHTRVDLIITDLLMPDQDGTQAIKRTRELDAVIPIIAISGMQRMGGFSPLEDALVAGADITLEKPFGMEQLLSAVNDLLLEHNSRGQIDVIDPRSLPERRTNSRRVADVLVANELRSGVDRRRHDRRSNE